MNYTGKRYRDTKDRIWKVISDKKDDVYIVLETDFSDEAYNNESGYLKYMIERNTFLNWINHPEIKEETMTQVWVAGHNIMEFSQYGTEYIAWSILGVFTNKEKAIAACHNEDCFIGPLNLDEPWPLEIIKWPGCYYPYEDEE